MILVMRNLNRVRKLSALRSALEKIMMFPEILDKCPYCKRPNSKRSINGLGECWECLQTVVLPLRKIESEIEELEAALAQKQKVALSFRKKLEELPSKFG